MNNRLVRRSLSIRRSYMRRLVGEGGSRVIDNRSLTPASHRRRLPLLLRSALGRRALEFFGRLEFSLLSFHFGAAISPVL